jgi:hypothetical protein
MQLLSKPEANHHTEDAWKNPGSKQAVPAINTTNEMAHMPRTFAL